MLWGLKELICKINFCSRVFRLSDMARCRERPQTAMCCLELGRLKIKYLGGMHLNHLNLAKPEFFLASFLQFLSVNCISPARIIALLDFHLEIK